MIKIWMPLFTVIAFSILVLNGRYYYDDYSYGLYIMCALSALPIFRIHWSIGVLFLYLILNGAYFTFNYPSPYRSYGFEGETFFKMVTSQATVVTLLSSFIFILPLKYISFLAKTLPWICICSSTIILTNRVMTGVVTHGGIMGNSSMDPTLIASLYPTIFFLLDKNIYKSCWFKWVLIPLPIIAIFTSKGSVGLGGLCVVFFTLIFLKSKKTAKGITYATITAAVLLSIASVTFNGQLFEGSLRSQIYGSAYDLWMGIKSYWLGTGISTFWGYGPLSQKMYWMSQEGAKHPPGHTFFTWMHSDWLQIIFELGVIGFLLSINTSYHLLKKTWEKRSPYLIASIITYALTMVFNMPWHWFMSMLCGIILTRLGFSSEEDYTTITT